MAAKRRNLETSALTEPDVNGVATGVRVSIFDQTYHLRGTDPAYISRLAEYVDGKIRAVAGQTNTVDTARLAVLAALNIADELFMQKRHQDNMSLAVDRTAERLIVAIDAALGEDCKAS